MNHKYTQSREDSLAILKRCIALMNHHEAPYTPVAFAVWYEHLVGINPDLSDAIDGSLKTTAKLSGEQVQALYERYVAAPDQASVQDASQRLDDVMQRMAGTAQATGSSAKVYGSQLADLSQALNRGDASSNTAAWAPQLSQVAHGTAEMQTAVSALQKTLEESRAQIDQLRHELDRSRTEALTDPLTGLGNRKAYDEAVAKALASPCGAGHVHGLIVFDLDHFKKINDTHGHPAGDAVLQGVGATLKRLAQTDLASSVVPCRIGGEEYVYVVCHTTKAHLVQLAESVRAAIRVMRIKKRGTSEVLGSITISGGVAVQAIGDDAVSWLQAADGALYRAKESGRDRILVA
jgi:diguanylate cyclase